MSLHAPDFLRKAEEDKMSAWLLESIVLKKIPYPFSVKDINRKKSPPLCISATEQNQYRRITVQPTIKRNNENLTIPSDPLRGPERYSFDRVRTAGESVF